jgi:hypothetical protein
MYQCGLPSDKADSTKGLTVTKTSVEEVVEMLGNAENVIIVSSMVARG